MSCLTVKWVGMAVCAKFGDSGSNCSRDIRAARFVMDDDERRTTADGDCGMRQNACFALKQVSNERTLGATSVLHQYSSIAIVICCTTRAVLKATTLAVHTTVSTRFRAFAGVATPCAVLPMQRTNAQGVAKSNANNIPLTISPHIMGLMPPMRQANFSSLCV